MCPPLGHNNNDVLLLPTPESRDMEIFPSSQFCSLIRNVCCEESLTVSVFHFVWKENGEKKITHTQKHTHIHIGLSEYLKHLKSC